MFAIRAFLLAPAVAACASAGSAGGPLCTRPSPSDSCWELLRPLGSGGFPAEPGSNDQPKWRPGKFPLGLFPVVAFGGQLWALSQTHAYSSPDGLDWTQHDKVADQDALLPTGSKNWKTAPRGVLGVAQMRPPWDSMIDRLMARPIPKPPGLVV